MPKEVIYSLTKTKNDDELFDFIIKSFTDNISTWEYFVNWQKVFKQIEPIEKELNLLNYLIGKEDFYNEAKDLLKKYPEVIKCFPILIALRSASIDVLVDKSNFLHKKYDFNSLILGLCS